DDPHDHREEDGDQCRQQHRFDRRGGDDVDRAPIFRSGRSLHDPGVLAELAPHFCDDFSTDTADRLHRKRREQERHQAADEETCAITAMPIPYSPAKWCAMRIPAAITSTGSAVAFMPTARPSMMFVACPVWDDDEMDFTGPQRVPV